MDTPKKILLLGDASNYSVSLAKGLRLRGHKVTLASNGCKWLDTERDIDLSRGRNKFGGAMLYWRLMGPLRHRLCDYDAVGINNPVCVDLRPHRVKQIFDMLRGNNKALFLLGTGTDTFYIDEAMDPASSLKYTEWRIGNRPAPLAQNSSQAILWQQPTLRRLCEHVYANVSGMTTALYEYQVAARRVLPEHKIAYAGIPIDLAECRMIELDSLPQKLRIFLGRHKERQIEKGTDLLEIAARRVVERHPDKAELVIVENRPYNEYIELLNSAHIVLDQVYSYTPATNALLAMARGQTVVSGGEEDFYGFIGEATLRPILNALPDVEHLTGLIENAVIHREDFRQRGLQAREFVEKHNSLEVVANRVVEAWSRFT